MSFQVNNDLFRGPIDLLLYLVRRHEVEVTEIALSKVTQEYLEHIDVLKEISIDLVGDFLDVASHLVEIKAKALLPRNEFEEEDEEGAEHADPRRDLVNRLLLYKKFRDASSLLEDRASEWQNRFSRIADDLPAKQHNISDQPIREIELWDLVSAFGRVLRDNQPVENANIVYDETPIHVYMERIHAKIVQNRRASFSELFELGMHKSSMVSIFLAVLELARHHGVVTQQDDLYGELVIAPGSQFKEELDVSNIDDYDPHMRSGDPASMIE
ncbi:segregation and condensation protein A [Mariniblastus fucicola]|uniref:Segregation and condensation protein A n=1 Tax=Mariniblastus fucicola TaxID=980251 RepID=A0A5B9PGN1_9BACT|nr:segregation/condensation protein A [Mariniblastus fucicola]QEG21913.1 Segregation and condensation protein A [Mariniblastus fucicola]